MATASSTTPVNRRPRKSGDIQAGAHTICLSLISHTNVGKTTLARTLLRRDVGQVLDSEHVTDVSEAHVLMELDGGKRLLLWDTPGFGNTASLLKRLRRAGQPVRAFLVELWDRFRNRPLWCSQQAVRNVQDEADVVLYLVDASQRPDDAAFVAMEMEILAWIGKPVLVLLNQLGPPRPTLEEEMEVEGWRLHLQRFSAVRYVLPLDAFARCWVQENVLLELLSPLLPPEKRQTYAELRDAWEEKNWSTFSEAMSVLGKQLASSVCDRVTVSKENFLQRLGVGRKSLNLEMDAAREQLSHRLAERSVAASNELIQLHQLTGQRRESLEKVRDDNFSVPQKVNESLWSAVGGILSGAAVGVAADLKTGGLTFGGGTIVGIFAGGAGSYLLAKGYNLARGGKDSVRFTEEHFAAQVETALLYYLAVSHWGRGRGDWAEAEHPVYWRERVRGVVAAHRKAFDKLWQAGGEETSDAEKLSGLATSVFKATAQDLLLSLYPRAGPILWPKAELPPPPPHDA